MIRCTAEGCVEIEGLVLVCTDGSTVTVAPDSAGVATGYGRIGNPYFEGDTEWRFKDGETVIECTADHPAAMPVADAYQELLARFDEEDRAFREYLANFEARFEHRTNEEMWDAEWAPVEELYQIQEALEGRR